MQEIDYSKFSSEKNIIGITMGDPVSIAPEIIVKAFKEENKEFDDIIVLGDANLLKSFDNIKVNIVTGVEEYKKGFLNVLNLSDLKEIKHGKPNFETSKAMMLYIEKGVELALESKIKGIVTAPINKYAMQKAGYNFPGHTEFLAHKTNTKNVFMMFAGGFKLKIVLVTIHIPLKEVASFITYAKVLETIEITFKFLKKYSGKTKPRIAVAGLNPHAGEGGLFGDEEEKKIVPAIKKAKEKGIDVSGPYPPDTIFLNAKNESFDAFISMYHDQALIPFKLLHFDDGVNVTLGLPIIRTSVDHGTAYDIAGKNSASPKSLLAAIRMAKNMALNKAMCQLQFKGK